jgi:hypothetical protein
MNTGGQKRESENRQVAGSHVQKANEEAFREVLAMKRPDTARYHETTMPDFENCRANPGAEASR